MIRELTCVELHCDGPHCNAVYDDPDLGEHIPADQYPGPIQDHVRDLAEATGWWCDDTQSLCPACVADPRRHTYAEPVTEPRWDTTCQLCGCMADDHAKT